MKKAITKELRQLNNRINKIVTNKWPKDLAKFNMTQLQIIFYLIKHENEEVCQKDLESETHLKKASITGTLDSLEEKGIIYRSQSNEDKRRNCILLTKEAQNKKQVMRELFEYLNTVLAKDISEKELNDFYNVMEKMNKNIDGVM